MNIKAHLLERGEEESTFEVKVNGKRQGIIKGHGKLPNFTRWTVPSPNPLLNKFSTGDRDTAIEECCRRNGRNIKKGK